jgi:hypothetical protein
LRENKKIIRSANYIQPHEGKYTIAVKRGYGYWFIVSFVAQLHCVNSGENLPEKYYDVVEQELYNIKKDDQVAETYTLFRIFFKQNDVTMTFNMIPTNNMPVVSIDVKVSDEQQSTKTNNKRSAGADFEDQERNKKQKIEEQNSMIIVPDFESDIAHLVQRYLTNQGFKVLNVTTDMVDWYHPNVEPWQHIFVWSSGITTLIPFSSFLHRVSYILFLCYHALPKEDLFSITQIHHCTLSFSQFMDLDIEGLPLEEQSVTKQMKRLIPLISNHQKEKKYFGLQFPAQISDDTSLSFESYMDTYISSNSLPSSIVYYSMKTNTQLPSKKAGQITVGKITEQTKTYVPYQATSTGCTVIYFSGPSYLISNIQQNMAKLSENLLPAGVELISVKRLCLWDVEKALKSRKNAPFRYQLFDMLQRMRSDGVPRCFNQPRM